MHKRSPKIKNHMVNNVTNDQELKQQIAFYHISKATKIFNKVVVKRNHHSQTADTDLEFKELIKKLRIHINQCHKLSYKDDKLELILSELSVMFSNGNLSDLKPIF